MACSSDSDDTADSGDDTSVATESSSVTSADPDASPTTLTPGTTLPVTVTAATDAATTASAETTAAPTTLPPSTYTVVAGDSLSLISDRTCMSLAELADLNGWDDGSDHVIHPGDVVQINPGACSGVPLVPANYTLPYTAPPTRAPAASPCNIVLEAYDTLFAGPPTDATEDAARTWATNSVAALRTAVETIQPPLDSGADLDALAAGEPDVAAAYVTFLLDTTNGEAYAAMQTAADAVGLSRYSLSITIGGACPA